MEPFQRPGACLVVERIIREGIYDASQEKGQSCVFVLERYHERSRPKLSSYTAAINPKLNLNVDKNNIPHSGKTQHSQVVILSRILTY